MCDQPDPHPQAVPLLAEVGSLVVAIGRGCLGLCCRMSRAGPDLARSSILKPTIVSQETTLDSVLRSLQYTVPTPPFPLPGPEFCAIILPLVLPRVLPGPSLPGPSLPGPSLPGPLLTGGGY